MPRRKRGRKNEEPDETVQEPEEAPRYFLNPAAVSKHLYCSVCQEVFLEPHRAPCGHSFCKRCIFEWLKNDKSCPIDRKKVLKGDLHHDFILENIIGDQQVACPFRWNGCQHVSKLEFLRTHKTGCQFNPENMPEFLRDHLKETKKSPHGPPETIDSDTEELPDPAAPPLRMRLFCADEEKRKLLCNMFGSTSSEADTTSPSRSPKRRRKDSKSVSL